MRCAARSDLVASCTILLSCLVLVGCADDARPNGIAGASAPASSGATPPPAMAGSNAAPAGSGGAWAAAAGMAGSASLGGAGGSPPQSGNAGGAAMPAGGGAAGTAGAAAATGGGTGGTDDAGSAGSAGSPTTSEPACERGVVQAEEVVFIGESFIAQTGAIPRLTSQLARDAGTIAMDESYRSFAVSGTQLTTSEIPMQYARAKAASPVKVVLMDGGGNDLLFSDRCTTGFDASCQAIVSVVDDLFAQMSADGVTDVVYFFYPEPMGIGASIKPAMDILRPEMKKLCDDATDVRCIWVDQRESWDGHYDAYTADGIHPTEAGAMASATQIWNAMVASCIAQ